MTAHDELEEYAAARWPDLVRTVRLLGAPEPVALEVAAAALSGLRRRWRRLSTSGDPDAELRELVVEAWDARRRGPWWDGDPSEALPAGLADLDHLDALTPSERVDTVLRHLDRSAGSPDPGWVAALALPVGAPPPGPRELRAVARRRRAKVLRRTAAAAVVLVLVAGLAVVVARLDREPPVAATGLPRPLASVTVGQDPGAWVTWYADGELHLGTTTVAVASLQAVVDVLGAAVYVDEAGAVVRVGPNGRRVLLGRTDDASTLVASADGDLVGWVDVGMADDSSSRPLLVVARADDGARRATYRLARRGTTRPVGLREDRMYVVDGDRTRVWRFGDIRSRGERDDATGTGMDDDVDLDGIEQVVGQLAVFGPAGSTRLAFLDPKDGTTPPSTWISLPGDQVAVARDGAVVAVRSGNGDVALVVQGVGGLVSGGLGDDDVALDVSVGPDRRVAYLVARAEDRTENRPTSGELAGSSFDGTLSLQTCTVSVSPRATECTRVVDLANTGELPVLAR